MDNNYLTLSFSDFNSLDYTDAHPIQVADKRVISEKLAQQGYEMFYITNIPLGPFRCWVPSYLDDMLCSYISLERILARKLTENHVAYLSDGLLIILGMQSGQLMKVTVTSVPNLDGRLLKDMTIETTVESYLYSWRKLIGQILTAANYVPAAVENEDDD